MKYVMGEWGGGDHSSCLQSTLHPEKLLLLHLWLSPVSLCLFLCEASVSKLTFSQMFFSSEASPPPPPTTDILFNSNTSLSSLTCAGTVWVPLIFLCLVDRQHILWHSLRLVALTVADKALWGYSRKERKSWWWSSFDHPFKSPGAVAAGRCDGNFERSGYNKKGSVRGNEMEEEQAHEREGLW